jgi:fructoselysine-6-P-deglycase FrlB-like protein
LGKPFDSELDRLPETYRWALEFPIDRLGNALRPFASLPLVSVGSGGSFTTAEWAAALHRELTGLLASAQTPMEAVAGALDLRALAVLLATAGGKNPDVLGAFQHLVVREPRRFLVLCLSPHSPLARLAAKYRFVEFVAAEVPSGKDGFLATNSLLASAVILARSYAEAGGAPAVLPADLSQLLGTAGHEETARLFDERCRPLWARDTLVVLHGPPTRPAALDLESKFSEAALGNIRAADYRNFAHGRHHWLAKRSGETAVLAFVTPGETDLASRTLAQIPAGIPVLRLEVPHAGAAAGISAVAQALFVVGSAGRARGVDPGRPGVPGFGRRIYYLRAFAGPRAAAPPVPPEETAAIERKSRRSVAALADQGRLGFWREAYAAFVRALGSPTFRGAVFDYDGTLCDEAERYRGLSAAVGRELTRLLRAGAVLGVATGRGKSVKEALRESLPRKYWGRIIVGYYNGGDVGPLDDGGRPDGSARVVDALTPVAAAIQGDPLLPQLADLELRLPQIKVEPKQGASAEAVWAVLQQVVHGQAVPGVMVVRSSHSMDVLAPGVTKRAVIERVAELLGEGGAAPILCVGDRGQWPGNDYSLLTGPHALSVDEVSQDPASCWNLAPPGHRGSQAALGYLALLEPGPGGLRVRAGGIGRQA